MFPCVDPSGLCRRVTTRWGTDGARPLIALNHFGSEHSARGRKTDVASQPAAHALLLQSWSDFGDRDDPAGGSGAS